MEVVCELGPTLGAFMTPTLMKAIKGRSFLFEAKQKGQLTLTVF